MPRPHSFPLPPLLRSHCLAPCGWITLEFVSWRRAWRAQEELSNPNPTTMTQSEPRAGDASESFAPVHSVLATKSDKLFLPGEAFSRLPFGLNLCEMILAFAVALLIKSRSRSSALTLFLIFGSLGSCTAASYDVVNRVRCADETCLRGALAGLAPNPVAPTTAQSVIESQVTAYMRAIAAEEMFPDFNSTTDFAQLPDCQLSPSEEHNECQRHMRQRRSNTYVTLFNNLPVLGNVGQQLVFFFFVIVDILLGVAGTSMPPATGSEADLEADLDFTRNSTTEILISGEISLRNELVIPATVAVVRLIGTPSATLRASGLHRIFSLAPYAEVELVNLTLVGGTAPGCASRDILKGRTYDGFPSGRPSWWAASMYLGTVGRSGGAIFAGVFTQLKVTGCILQDHVACAEGGAVCGDAFSKMEFRGTKLANNRAWGFGGAIHTGCVKSPRTRTSVYCGFSCRVPVCLAVGAASCDSWRGRALAAKLASMVGVSTGGSIQASLSTCHISKTMLRESSVVLFTGLLGLLAAE